MFFFASSRFRRPPNESFFVTYAADFIKLQYGSGFEYKDETQEFTVHRRQGKKTIDWLFPPETRKV